MEARGAPEGEGANEKKHEERSGQERHGSPMQRYLRNARHGGKNHEDGAGGGDEQPVPDAARRRGFASRLAAVHAGFDIVRGDTVSAAFALRRFFPTRLLLTGRGREGHCADSQHHEKRTADDLYVGGRTASVQLAKNKNAPKQSPELIGIGERNAAADADIFG